jgi:hypothetical protein
MSDSSTATEGAPRRLLPEWARPREREKRGLGSLRLAETTILLLLGVLLAIATVNDVVQQTHVNHRIVADLHTWRVATGHPYHTLTTEQDIKSHTTRDVVCGNVSPGGSKERTQVCLTLVGPARANLRSVSGGYYLPPKTIDVRANRYACFGVAAEVALCGLGKAPAGAPPAPALAVGRP